MTRSDAADDLEIEDIETSGGGTVKRAVGLVAVLAVFVVLAKLKRRGGSSAEAEAPERGDVEHPDVDADREEERGIDTVSTKDEGDDEDSSSADRDASDEDDDNDDNDSGLSVKTSKNRGISATSGRFEDLDVVDYLAIFASALQAARDEYRIRTEN